MLRYQDKITAQMTRLGGSFDWDRVAFTMNDVSMLCPALPVLTRITQSLSKAVRETFCLMHEKGLLYRANRLVNWCVYLNTSLSNLEVCQHPKDQGFVLIFCLGRSDAPYGPNIAERQRLRREGALRIWRHHFLCVSFRRFRFVRLRTRNASNEPQMRRSLSPLLVRRQCSEIPPLLSIPMILATNTYTESSPSTPSLIGGSPLSPTRSPWTWSSAQVL